MSTVRLCRRDSPADLTALAPIEPALRALATAAATGGSKRILRFALCVEPLSIDAGEVADQRACPANRDALVDVLYASPPPIVTSLRESARCWSTPAT